MQNGQSILFVINPVSGGSKKNDWEKRIRELLKEQEVFVAVCMLTGKDDKQALQRYMEEIKPAKVVAVGGDGTVKLVAEVVKESTTILGIVPAGSANGLAKEL